ncbi:MAG: hypothetical protein HYX34_15660 [Actinobacteria bacterium]|nr:hypothetical protein [Actinomycetota bacterium]
MLGGIAFSIGGATHPRDNGTGNKVQQLHDMLVKPAWYPSHAVMVAAMALFAAAIFALRQRPGLTPGIERTLKWVFVIASVATIAMVTHLFAALDAESLAGGKPSLVSRVQTVNETVFDAAWGVALATLAVVGGLTRTVGNRITIPFGVVGGLAFALASATIAYTDTFDPLFQVGSLLSLWAILVGVTAIRGRR